jgi:hypothetical protein
VPTAGCASLACGYENYVPSELAATSRIDAGIVAHRISHIAHRHIAHPFFFLPLPLIFQYEILIHATPFFHTIFLLLAAGIAGGRAG